MAVFRVRSPTRRAFGLFVFLLFIFLKMFTSLVIFAGVFILSDKGPVSPFNFCPTRELSCGRLQRFSWYTKIKVILLKATIIGLYSPVVLVAFALLALLLAVYAKDRAALWFSMACQAASGLLILTGITAFLLLHQSYVSWEGMTIWFYICVAVPLELIIMTVLTLGSGRRTSDWE